MAEGKSEYDKLPLLGVERLTPTPYEVYISPIAEYILGIDVLRDLVVQTTQGEFCLRVPVVKTVNRGHPHHAPLRLPQATWVVNVKQYRLPRGHEEIGRTILKLEEAGVIHLMQRCIAPIIPLCGQFESLTAHGG